MSSWKKIVLGIKNDASLIKKELIVFSVIYLLLNSLSILSSFILPNLAQSKLLMLAFFLGTLLLCVLLFVNQYFFQKAYSEKKKAPALINGLWKTLLRIIQLYTVQSLIIIAVLFVGMILLAVGMILFVVDQSLIIIILVVVGAIALIFWIYRINFVSSIFLYKRIDWKSRAAIKESIYLIKSNALVVLPLWLLPVLLLVPGIIENVSNPGVNNPHILMNCVVIILSLASSIVDIHITVNALIEHKYCFLLKPEEEKILIAE